MPPPDERDDAVRKFTSDFDHLPGVVEAQRRMAKHSHRIFPAFNSLDIFDHASAAEYLAQPARAIKVPKDQHARFIGLLLAFGITCVEADRKLRGEES